MSDPELVLRRICSQLDAADLKYALVGGLAVSVRTTPRFTKDVDLAVLVATDDEAENFSHKLQDRGYKILAVLESKVNGHLSTVRFASDDATFMEADVGLIFASSGIEPEIVQQAEITSVLGLDVPVARLGHLLALKVLSEDVDRKQDGLDIESLLKVAGIEEIDEARRAMALITERGFNRQKDLETLFDTLLTSMKYDPQ